jgi:dipeptidyl aminopeptidase/acylaminoacyl peptidase
MRFAAMFAVALTSQLSAQVTADDYRRAEQFLPGKVDRLISNDRVTPRWFAGSDRFWYHIRTAQGPRFKVADAARKTVTDAFDHQRLASALASASGTGVRADSLPFTTIIWSLKQDSVIAAVAGKSWRCNLASYSCAEAVGLGKVEPGANYSPDSSMRLVRSGGNIGLRRGADTTTTLLTTDAESDNDYGSMAGNSTAYVSVLRAGIPLAPQALWSPDSRRFVSYRLDQRGVGLLHLVQSVPLDSSFRTRAWAYRYALPGDTIVSRASLLVFDPARRTVVPVQLPATNVVYQDPVSWNEVTWNSDGSKLYVLQMARGAQSYAVHEVNPETGAARRLAEERSRTLAEPSLTLGQRDFHPLTNGQVIWFSERDGWAHLYLLNGGDGAVVRQLTSGPWIVIRLVRVDEVARRIYFVGAGREQGRDPYLRHFYSVSLDGGAPTLLTPEDADHEVQVAPSGKWFLDRASRWDKSPVTSLRSLDGKSSFEVERADISALVAAGWRAPERLKLVAADGSTDIYGLLYRPAKFDSTRRYPILEEVYPGPQANAASPIFQAGNNVRALTELGFTGLVVDGRGTPYRSKAFHDYSYGRLENGGGLEDHVAALDQLARRFSWFDTSRVGVFGHSGGGFMSTRAMLMYPGVYKVAVSSAGNHDQRGYLAIWGESYQGMPSGKNYEAQANQLLAANLKGKLLLMTGDLDDNVHPMLTMWVADALIKANKDFDFLVVPNTNHGSAGSLYFQRRRWDYFVKNLMGVEPPREYLLK